jgi:hypothetical protein
VDWITKILGALGGLIGTGLGIYNFVHARRQEQRTRANETNDWQMYSALRTEMLASNGDVYLPNEGSTEHQWAERMVARGLLDSRRWWNRLHIAPRHLASTVSPSKRLASYGASKLLAAKGNLMRRIFLTLLLLLAATFSTGNAITPAADDVQVRATISVWHDLNAMCRGGHGDDPQTMIACCTREKVSALLNQMGYCYRMGERWVKCTARDKRAVPSTKLCY